MSSTILSGSENLSGSRTQTRVQSIDILRGAVMIIMALDHTRDFLSSAAISFPPEDLTRTTAAIFLTRWITHFCAPVFMFTAGLGAYFWAQRGRTRGELSRFLWTRGLWLIVLELTLVRFIIFFSLSNSVVLTVLWALGWAMIALAGLVYLPPRALLAVSLGMIALHNLLDPIMAPQFGSAAWIWNVLHQSGVFRLGGAVIVVGYPLIPWIGVMAAGYCFGRVFTMEAAQRRKLLIRMGLGITAGFIVLRAVNVYGDLNAWSTQRSALFTALSFLNCTKYPPSLDFLLMTLGPAILAMGLIDRVRLSPKNPLFIFGRVPLFYFVVHLAVAHLSAVLLGFFRYGKASFLLYTPPNMGGPRQAFPADYGFDLWVCYAVWFALLVIVYPLCRWFAGLKQRRSDWWLSYL